MGEPVDPAADWLATRGAARPVTLAAYRPATDDFGPPADCRGVPGPKRKRAAGDVTATTRAWTLSGLAAAPVLRSLVADGSDAYAVDAVTADPAGGGVYRCETTLLR